MTDEEAIEKMKNIIILGVARSGKTTLARMIKQKNMK